MRRPPGPPASQLFFSRPTYEWINRINQKHKHFAELHLSREQEENVKRWVENEFARSALALDELPTETGSLISETIESLRVVEAVAKEHGNQAALTTELLLGLHNPPGDKSRELPTFSDQLLVRIESAIRWFSMESFGELNPVEQASIVFLRLVEIRPFERLKHRTALVSASLFTLRSNLPPLIIKPDQVDEYRAAIDDGMRMDTRPMVEMAARSIETTLGEMIKLAGRK